MPSPRSKLSKKQTSRKIERIFINVAIELEKTQAILAAQGDDYNLALDEACSNLDWAVLNLQTAYQKECPELYGMDD